MSKEQMHHQLSQQIGKIKLKIKTKKIDWQKIDGIIHHLTYNMELGALEAARSFVNDGDKKLPIESFKMPKTLKDILVNMIRSKRILHFRYNIQFVRLAGLYVSFQKMIFILPPITFLKQSF
ncbi:unnamed protein product [Rhizophagus irregularis]|nr:unnamed protein product [Rhizophagus irregularis]CAB5373706.1 unnamed protein product [Rhizophagus irregularis]